MSFQWQASPDGGTTWVNVPANGGSTTVSYTPRDALTEGIVGQPLRVQVSYTDALGVLENVFSAPTDVLGNFNQGIIGSGGGALAQANATTGADNLAGLLVLSGNNVIDGLAGDDIINGREGQDTLIGGAGNDFITGGTGRDTMTGGTGADIFDFNAAAESPVGGGAHDIITDFLAGTDRIDVSTIDANAAILGNQAFAPVVGPFTANGQVRVTQLGTSTLVEFNTAGGAGTVPEFEIELQNVVAATLTFADLIP